ncbi:MAG: hydrogenase expression/formation protein HypE [Phycisphaerales bacterium JB039]
MSAQGGNQQPTTYRPAVNPQRREIVLAHGGGGQLTDELIRDLIAPRFANSWLDRLDDSAVLPEGPGEVVFTTDSYVIQPLEFPGGDIGRLAVCGTVNDLAVCGARPEFLSLALILEEGLRIDTLRRVLDSAARAAEEAQVRVVTGDTKVVARGQADGMYINTAGIGRMRQGVRLGAEHIQPGDVVLVTGPIADHGLAVMLQRERQSSVRSELASDVAPLGGMLGAALERLGGQVVFMRDATRGGLAGVLADMAERSGWRLVVDEATIPVRPQTLYAAEMLGLDPLDVANEGKAVVVVRPGAADAALAALRADPLGAQAARIGAFENERWGVCELVTDVGGRRIIQKPYGEELPRIC